MIGETIGNFQIVAFIGRGGMGEVFLAQQTAIETQVAIKVLPPEVSADTDQIKRFFNEARAASKIKHAGIVKIFDVGFHEPTNRAYLVMEYLEGESLGDRMTRLQRLPLDRIVDFGRQIAGVLDATHAAGIIHRDLKPDNMFLVPDQEMPNGERVKILDFGIAKLTDAFSGPRTLGAMGTPPYMAPEQWGEAALVDWRADLYSLGCVLYEMACGAPPFLAGSLPELFTKHLMADVPSLRVIAPELPEELDIIIQRLLAKNPAARPESMRTVARMFDAMTSGTAGLSGSSLAVSASIPVAPPLLRDSTEHVDTDTIEHDKTTLSRASLEVLSNPRKRIAQHALPFALGCALVLVLLMIAVVASRRGDKVDLRPAASLSASPHDAASVTGMDASAAPFGEWIQTANAFVLRSGIVVQSHQVTRGEYARYLASLPAERRDTEMPVYDWNDSAPDQPVGWVTQERAVRFCKAIDAKLPTSQQWEKLAAGSWGIDALGSGSPGPFPEWTSTVDGGFATVRGGYVGWPPNRNAEAATRKPQKELESALKNPTSDRVADERLGFRCVR